MALLIKLFREKITGITGLKTFFREKLFSNFPD
jgi:hypothetical protein